MLSASRSKYICWRCVSNSVPGTVARGAARNGQIGQNGQFRIQISKNVPRLGLADRQTFATVSQGSTSGLSSLEGEDLASRNANSIRDRLRQWEIDNPSPADLALPEDSQGAVIGLVPNSRMGGSDGISFDEDSAEQAAFREDGLLDIRSDGTRFEPGDMLEVSSVSWNIDLLAICLGTFNGLDHFYTNTGKWMTSSSIHTRFVVKNFIKDLSDLEPVLKQLPPPDTPAERILEMQALRVGPSRSAGAALLDQMLAFQLESRRIHHAHLNKLNRAFWTLGAEENIMTLNEIANKLLPMAAKRKGSFSPQALYAVHTAIRQEDIGFRAISSRGSDHSYYFVILSKDSYRLVEAVEKHVRQFYEDPTKRPGPQDLARLVPHGALKDFVHKARKVLDHNRKARDWSTHGILGPAKRPTAVYTPEWSESDLLIIKFLDCWARERVFTTVSRLHWVGASILRALKRYGDAEYLTSTIGWVFLQEIGWVVPWDIGSRHWLRLPGVPAMREGGAVKPKRELPGVVLHPDRFEQSAEIPGRKPTATKVYCIDAESTLDVDDGISLERTDQSGEYWVNIHVADPASRIAHDSPAARHAALASTTRYLPGFYESMFSDPIVRETFSLAPGRPSLTFSARVDEDGNVLGYRIEPTVLKDVAYMTPEEVTLAAGTENPQAKVSSEMFAVGQPPSTLSVPPKPMTRAGDLSSEEKEDLGILSRLALALQKAREAKGAIPAYAPRPQVSVSYEHVEVTPTQDGFFHSNGDPYIKVSYSDSGGLVLVSSLMQLAGEVAARWAAARGIPLPFRNQAPNPAHREALDVFTRDVLYPQLAKREVPRADQWRQLRSLLGGQQLLAVPGPVYTMGLDMYAKVTSPLRRYADLLAHWQIEAALIEEARRGASLVGNTDDDSFLPFKRAELTANILPMLKLRERHARLADNLDGPAEWMLQALVRAWKFGAPPAPGSAPLPATFRFTANELLPGRAVLGQIDWFERRAVLDVGGLGDVALLRDIAIGDVFEVEIADVFVSLGQILVRALKRIE